MLILILGAALAAIVFECAPSCYAANCRAPFVWRWRRLDDGHRRALCGKCARHVDRIRSARVRRVPS